MTEPILIRVWKQGDQNVKKYGLKEVHITDMIMIFPCDPSDVDGWTCGSYMYHGGHGACCYKSAVVPNTRPATKEETERMLAHYKLTYSSDVEYKVYTRWQRWFDVERLKEIK